MEDLLSRDAVESWIAQERVQPGKPPTWFVACVLILFLAVVSAAAYLATTPVERTEAEDLYREGDGLLQAFQSLSEPAQARLWNAVAGAVAAAATAIIGWRLFHSPLGGLLAGALVGLDTGVLAHSRLATPVAPVLAAGLVAWALFLHPGVRTHWVGAFALSAAAFLDPSALLWGIPCAVLLLMRGHIYAAPQHALVTGTQTLLLPAAAALLGIAGADSLSAGCYQASRTEALLQTVAIDQGGILAAHNPVLWFAGLGVILFLGIGAGARVMRDFRVQRLPGRIQFRLTQPLRRAHGRALWLLFFALLAPTPIFMVPVAALAIAAGSLELGKDARGFGITVALVFLVFVAAYTLRLAGLIMDGTGLEHLPWASTRSCG